MTDVMEYALSCSICMELYNEPMLLPCAHSLCKECLEKLRRPSGKTVSKTINCPQCRRKLDIGEKCENVKKNFQLASIIDIYQQESERRQQLDAERSQQQQQQGQPPQIQAAQRIQQLQQSHQGAKPKLSFFAQLRQKRRQKKKSSPNNQTERNSNNSSTNDGAPGYILNPLAALRETSDQPQGPKPQPRRSAPPPPLPRQRGRTTEDREQTPPKLPPSRPLPSRVVPPIPRRSYQLSDTYPRLNPENDTPQASQPPSQTDSSRARDASPSGSQDSKDTQESEETIEPDTMAQFPTSTTVQPNSTSVDSTNVPITNISDQATNASGSVSEQENQGVDLASNVLPDNQEPDILINIPEATFPEQTQQVECPSENNLVPECCTCERVPAFPATVQCQTCAMLFCSSCLGAFHPEPDDSQHEVKPITEIKIEEKCVLCEKEKWSIFCMECNMLFCQGCQLGHHPAELRHWTHDAPIQRSISISGIPIQHTQPPLQRRAASVPSGMATQGLEEATDGSSNETLCSSCSQSAFARCLDCGENLCEMCARVKHQSADLENHTVVKLSESKLKMEDVETLVQLGMLELMLLKQALMEELSSKARKD